MTWSAILSLFDWFTPDRILSQNISFNESFKTPNEIDWRTHGAVTKIRDQKKDADCGSCYAFASIAALESQHFVKTGHLLELSVQEIVDCSSKNKGCNGGSEDEVYNYIAYNGIGLAKDYIYESNEGRCRKNKAPRSEVEVFGFVEFGTAKDITKAIAEFGPVVVGLDLYSKSFRFYKEGIYDDPECTSGEINHLVVAVGFGTDEASGLDYWILKNSFSESWGEKGYMRLLRDPDSFPSSISACFPLLNREASDNNRVLENRVLFKISFLLVFLIVVSIMVMGCISCFRMCRNFCRKI